MSVIAKFNKLFPNSKVWMIEPYISDKIPVVMFELTTNERSLNIYNVKDILTITSVLFEEKCYSVEVHKSYFTEQEHTELQLLHQLDLKEYSHQQMDEIINLNHK